MHLLSRWKNTSQSIKRRSQISRRCSNMIINGSLVQICLWNIIFRARSEFKSPKSCDGSYEEREEETNRSIAINLSERNEDSKRNASNQKHPKIIFIHTFWSCFSYTKKYLRLIGRFFHFKNKENCIHQQNPCGEGNQCDKGILDHQEGKQQKHKPCQSADGLQRVKSLAIFKGLDKPLWDPSTFLFGVCIFRHLTSLKSLISSTLSLTFSTPITK